MNKSQEILMYLKIIHLNLTPDEYFYIRLLQSDKMSLSEIDEAKVLESLAEKGIDDPRVVKLDEETDLDVFVDKYRSIFPRMLLPSGKSARSTASEVRTKMKWFFANHGYTEDQVLAATKAYVDERAEDDYLYMQTASYFIYKDDRNKVRSSSLAERCEVLETNIDQKTFDVDV